MFDNVKKAVDWIFGQTNKQKIAKLRSYVDQVNNLSGEVANLSSDEFKKKTKKFKDRIEEGAELEELIPEAFALVREVAERETGMRPYDVQIIGAVALHQRRIAEMATGEGKTLVATMPAYLNALVGQVHIATVNDYLAKRDREWMGPIYESLGLDVSVIQEDMDIEARKEAYKADIVYGTANQFGFDYLRDNMVLSEEQRVGAARDFAIVDEIDSTLIDEARTPLIISGSTEESTKLYKRFSSLAPRFNRGDDYEIDEKNQSISLTDQGANKAENFLHLDDLYSPENISMLHHLKISLKAKEFFKKDEDYIVKDGSIVLVDEFTGRLMPDRRLSDGLHQAIEAKEGMMVQKENQTFAQITLQNFFLLYDGLSGMTGTAKTEEDEFEDIYNLDVVVVPTNEPLRRDHKPDVIFKTKKAKYEAVADEVEKLHEKGRPVLVGTNAIEKSERLSKLLQKRGLPHEVLNAKNHAREAEIIKDAGQRGAVTIATNMAGRGTDIKLEEGVAELGGLHVLGTQRHESRRIDNQLRGRAGRQGDPGSTQFYLSLEDDLLRIFGGDRIDSLMEKAGMEEGQAIEHSLLTKAIRRAQKKVEGINYERRKNVLKYDKVLAQQREAIYSLRNHFVLSGEDSSSWKEINSYLEPVLMDFSEDLVENYGLGNGTDEENIEALKNELSEFQNSPFEEGFGENGKDIAERVKKFILANWENQLDGFKQAEQVTPELIKSIIIKIIDRKWRQHLYLIDDLKAGVGWSSYGGKDPLVEFKRESFRLFQDMRSDLRREIVEILVKTRLAVEGSKKPVKSEIDTSRFNFQQSGDTGGLPEPGAGEGRATGEENRGGNSKPTTKQRIVEDEPGRNDPCPCGSGKKYKYCCGADD
ncbi:preprotein translocase subunit SecA [Candidatus Bipolaricaulota bacterium]|nr:preprotein translocase subunit SecA [Candidatus Bipolaricaulota bacterium]MBS3825906.1 preprotein translocase subunit SecA [Candidatus Bipolaricaulota bacterium]